MRTSSDHLEKYAGHEKIVGFRHVVHDEADDQFILRPDFNAGIKALSRYPLCYDILIFERHLPQTITFVDQHPGLRIVVDHIAKPRIRRDAFDQAWAANIKRLAQREHVTCKLSGMVTEVDGRHVGRSAAETLLRDGAGSLRPRASHVRLRLAGLSHAQHPHAVGGHGALVHCAALRCRNKPPSWEARRSASICGIAQRGWSGMR